ncbi:unnamed protein product [Spirodela intermedia]|uniref:WPP domain-containing protein n=1 Tax=Spirodela intermedia TaxID=51605 RepID=A0A7I8K747_SPIIN|nr:unnamed protein product [Spirodela intermedia]
MATGEAQVEAREEPVATVEGDEGEKKMEDLPTSHSMAFQIWPPSQRTRDAVIKRLVETLSSTSILSKRYGTVPLEEASALARQIEGEAFSAAASAAPPASAYADGIAAATEEGGIETLQLYSKEISKRMLDAVKARVPPSSASSVDTQPDPSAVAPAVTEEASSHESESS